MEALNCGLVPTLRIEISDTTQVAAARRSAIERARELDFSEEDVGRVALVTTEAATNLVKHAGGGEVLVSVRHWPVPGVEVIAIDRGPGFVYTTARADGFSTAGTLGQGLGAMKRMATELDVYSSALSGSIVRALVCEATRVPAGPAAFEYGAIALPHPGESVCGDAWCCHVADGRALLMVVDGLGHGALAHTAARAAVDDALPVPGSAVHLVERLHGSLRGTRGAAIGAVCAELREGRLGFCGVGNITAATLALGDTRHFVSVAGILGHNVRSFRGYEQPWEPGRLLVMHSDGLGTHWNLKDDPELLAQHPSVVAAALYRAQHRGRDDSTVLVARLAPEKDH
jgi:anti-sigma regulatory factor (Ser/Thr protein kinase)